MSALEKLMGGVLSISAIVTIWSGCAKMLEPMPEQMDAESSIVALYERLDTYNDMIDDLGDIVDAAEELYGSDENVENPAYTISGEPPEGYQDPKDAINDILDNGVDIPGKGDSTGDIVIGVKEGDIRDGHTGNGTGAEQVKFGKPIDSYISDGEIYEVDRNGNRVYEDTGNNSFEQGKMPGDWQSRTENYDQSKVDSYLDKHSENYNPANYERCMAQCRCDAYDEIHDSPFYQMSKEDQQELLASDPDKAMDMRATAWDSMSPEERNEMRESNPQRAEALEQDFFGRLIERDGDEYGALDYGYTPEDLQLDDERYDDGYDMLDSNLGRDDEVDSLSDPTDVANRQFTPEQAKAELEASKADVEANPYLDYNSEMSALEHADAQELQTGFVQPEKMYPGNDGFLADQRDGELHTGDIISRYSEKGEPGSSGRFASRAEMGEDGTLRSPSYADRAMVNLDDRMEEHFYQVAPKQNVEQVDDGDYPPDNPPPPDASDDMPPDDPPSSGDIPPDDPPPPGGSGEVLPSDDSRDRSADKVNPADSPDESIDEPDPAKSLDEAADKADQAEPPDEATDEADRAESSDESTDEADQADSPDEAMDEVDQVDSPDESTDKADQADSPDESTDEADQAESPDEATDETEQTESPAEATDETEQAESPDEATDETEQAESPEEVTDENSFQNDFSDYSESGEYDDSKADQTDSDEFSGYSEDDSADNVTDDVENSDFSDYSEEEGSTDYASETESDDFSEYSEQDSIDESGKSLEGADDFTDYSDEEEDNLDTDMDSEYSQTEDTFDNIETGDMDGSVESAASATESVDSGSVDSGGGESVS